MREDKIFGLGLEKNMTKPSIFEQYMENTENRRIFEQERVLVDAAELVTTAMELRGVNRSELANRLDCSKAYITQVLRGSQNLTLKTLADVFYGLNCRLILGAHTEAGMLFNRPWNMTHETSNTVVITAYKQADQDQDQDRNQSRNQNQQMAYAA
jgi:transcriptional regulator with XRE-family HTH domain